jgi:hypothetical protein
MTKLWHAFYSVTGCLLVLGLLCPMAVAQQQPQAARLAIDHAPFNTAQRRGAPLVIEARITSPAGIRKAEVFCRAIGGGDFTALPMEAVEEHRYRAVVPDWMTAGPGLEYYITATDERGQSASQGFVGFPLAVRLVVGQGPTQEERLKALQENLDILRQNRERTNTPQNLNTPSPRPR